jgi:molecular chaperone DnaJ
MTSDYYDRLGVPRSASQEEIRKAYRRMARERHPDVRGHSAEAESDFRAINEAYEVLRDPGRRAAYDRYGPAGVRGAGGSSGPVYTDFADLGDIFEQFLNFGQRTRRGPVSPAERRGDLRSRVRLTFEEAAFGCTREVQVARRETCDSCAGSGAAPGTSPDRCPTCDGTGEVQRVSQSFFGQLVNVRTCSDCRGTGQVVRHPCPECGGAGRAVRNRTLEVDVPAGVTHDMQIRLAGQGDHGRLGGTAGDLYVTLEVEAHESFVRDGDDVLLEVRINAADAALGADIQVPTLDGPGEMRLPAGTQTGDTFALPGRGIPHLRGPGRGDQVVTVIVETPPRLTREQRELYERLRTTLPEPSVVARSKPGFWERVRERFA